jgi:hypothetical protein
VFLWIGVLVELMDWEHIDYAPSFIANALTRGVSTIGENGLSCDPPTISH